MSAEFIERLLSGLCRHRFSWPRTAACGQDYQVCLDCGAAYEFDCTTMQRTGRLAMPLNGRGESLAYEQPND